MFRGGVSRLSHRAARADLNASSDTSLAVPWPLRSRVRGCRPCRSCPRSRRSACSLAPHLVGHRVVDGPGAADRGCARGSSRTVLAQARLTGARIAALERRGKYLLGHGPRERWRCSTSGCRGGWCCGRPAESARAAHAPGAAHGPRARGALRRPGLAAGSAMAVLRPRGARGRTPGSAVSGRTRWARGRTRRCGAPRPGRARRSAACCWTRRCWPGSGTSTRTRRWPAPGSRRCGAPARSRPRRVGVAGWRRPHRCWRRRWRRAARRCATAVSWTRPAMAGTSR